MATKYSDEQKQEVLKLHAEGLTAGAISKQTGIPKGTISTWIARSVNISEPPQAVITQSKPFLQTRESEARSVNISEPPQAVITQSKPFLQTRESEGYGVLVEKLSSKWSFLKEDDALKIKYTGDAKDR